MNDVSLQFNKKSMKERWNYFSEIDNSKKMRRRKTAVAVGGESATFVFDDENNTCYILRFYERTDTIVAVEADKAEKALDSAISRSLDEAGCQYFYSDDARLTCAYIDAADRFI